MKPAVFLDRDNTLIENDGDLGDPGEVKLIKGAASAIASLRGLGFTIVVVSNQGGVARGKFGESDVDAVNRRLNELIQTTTRASVDRFYYCPYHPEGTVEQYRKEHPWRKPNPGMILQAAKDLDLDLGRSWMIGDQIRDVQAGRAAGVRTILLRPGSEKTLPGDETEYRLAREEGDEGKPGAPTYVAPTLAEAVKVVAQMPRPERALDLTGAAVVRGRVDGRGEGGKSGDGGSGGDEGCVRAVRSVDTRPRRVVMRQAVAISLGVETGQEVDEGAEEAQVVGEASTAVVEAAEEGAVVEVARPDEVGEEDGGEGAEGVAVEEEVTEEVERQDEPVGGANGQVSSEVGDDVAGLGDSPSVSGHGDVSLETVVRQILQELRSQRQVDGDFSYVHVVAIILQMIAVTCLLGALWLGSGDLEAFVRWIMAAMVLQIATVAALLFRR